MNINKTVSLENQESSKQTRTVFVYWDERFWLILVLFHFVNCISIFPFSINAGKKSFFQNIKFRSWPALVIVNNFLHIYLGKLLL